MQHHISNLIGRGRSPCGVFQAIGCLLVAMLVIVVCPIGSVHSATISLGDHLLAFDTTLEVDILIDGTEMVDALDFFLEVEDGAAGAPRINSVTFQSPGALFDTAGTTTIGPLPGSSDQRTAFTVFTIPTPVTISDGLLLATVELSAVGVGNGTFLLELDNVSGFDTRFLNGLTPIVPTLFSGTITVFGAPFNFTPEPTTVLMVTMGMLPMLFRRRSR